MTEVLHRAFVSSEPAAGGIRAMRSRLQEVLDVACAVHDRDHCER
jgi:hypothetical protein